MTDRKDIRNEPNQPPAQGNAGPVASLVTARLPLGAGLQALAAEAPSFRLRRTLREMADELSAGESVDVVLAKTGRGLPGYVRGLVQAGVQSGQLGRFLEEFLLAVRRRRAARHNYWISLAYPLLLVPLTLLATSVLMWIIIPQFKEIFQDFGVELPWITVVAIEVSDLLSVPVLIGFPWVVLAGVLSLLAMPAILGGPPWTRFLQHLPIIGTASRMRGMAEFCSLLGLLVSGGIRLPEALTATSGALQDANLKSGSRKLADRISTGQSMYDAAGDLPNFPDDLRTLFRWENRDSSFGDMLRQAGSVFAARSQVQLGIVGLFFQPLLLLFVGSMVALTVIALFMPLITLLNDLS